MEPARGSRRLRSWSQFFLLLAASHSWSGAWGQDLQVLQPKDPVSVEEGKAVTLNCSVVGMPPPGPMLWFKGKGPQRQEIYRFRGGTYSRIKAAIPSSNTDFSISISHITPEDSGTYYCIKFKKGSPDDTEYKSGGGTILSVIAKPSQPLVSGPQKRVNAKEIENFTCTSIGFSPKNITLLWFKNGNEIRNSWTKVFPEGDSVSYNITSTVQVKLEAIDVHSQLICEVKHNALQSPLRGIKNLSDIIRVKPEVYILPQDVSTNDGIINCHVNNFYPQNVSVQWIKNGSKFEEGKTSEATENKNGTFSLSTLVNISALKEELEITCQVFHDSQPPINATKTFHPLPPSETIDKKPSAKGSTSSTRLHEPEKNARDLSQIQEANDINNDITYADLNLPKGKKSTPRAMETNNQTEYASIQTGPSPQREDNLTYADLDMVHLNRSSKKTTTRPEESYSEYASVQVQRK
ncbi:tyrosine-protein phosphatase non-receptor type substrate 1-like isoform X2 [Macrotis lagotis]|uniref:tyrosine-protein phosphatase non-receptor type substrate 1-like isoform X2 n=1 Tax=Macrotis lagotis TaxID=92651 RepID=UPI003D69945F